MNTTPDPAANVQRYDCGGPVVPAVSGPFVLHSDYAALLAKLAAAEGELDYHTEQCKAFEHACRDRQKLTQEARGAFDLVKAERDALLTRTERAEKLLGEALPAIDDRFCGKDLADRIQSHLAASRGRG